MGAMAARFTPLMGGTNATSVEVCTWHRSNPPSIISLRNLGNPSSFWPEPHHKKAKGVSPGTANAALPSIPRPVLAERRRHYSVEVLHQIEGGHDSCHP